MTEYVRNFEELTQEMQEYLQEMMERIDNFKYGDILVDLNPDVPSYHPHLQHFTQYSTDLEVLKKIDSFSISTPEKLILYLLYEPELLSLEETKEIVEVVWSRKGYEVTLPDLKEELKEMILKAVGYDLDSLNENDRTPTLSRYELWAGDDFYTEVLFKYLYGDERHRSEDLDEIARLNKFLKEAEEDETFDQFYQRVDSEISPSDLHHTDFLKELFNRFTGDGIGSLGKNISEDVKRELKRMTKEEYFILFYEDRGTQCKKIETFQLFKYWLEGDMEKFPSAFGNHSLILRLLRKRLSRGKNRAAEAKIEEIFHRVYEDDDSAEWFKSKRYHDFTKILLTEEEKLSLRQILALLYSFHQFGLWIDVRAGFYHEEFNELFFDLLYLDLEGVSKLLEYMVFENLRMPPTYQEWKKITPDLLGLPPSVLFSYLSVDRDEQEGFFLNDEIEELRFFFEEVEYFEV